VRRRLQRTTAEVFGRLSRLKQATLGCRQQLFGATLFVLEANDGGVGFLLAALEAVALLLGLVTFSCELLALLLNASRVLRRTLQLGIKADDRLLVAVVIGIE